MEFRWKGKLSSLGPSFRLALPRGPVPSHIPMPGFHTGKPLCHAPLPDLRVVSFTLHTWLSHPSSGTRNSRSPVWKPEAESHGVKGTLWLACTFHMGTADPLSLLFSGKGDSRTFVMSEESWCMPSSWKSSFPMGFPTPKRQGEEVAVSLNVCIGTLDLTFWRKGTEHIKSEFSQEILSGWSQCSLQGCQDSDLMVQELRGQWPHCRPPWLCFKTDPPGRKPRLAFLGL